MTTLGLSLYLEDLDLMTFYSPPCILVTYVGEILRFYNDPQKFVIIVHKDENLIIFQVHKYFCPTFI
jgi:hypothetical protein